MITRASGQRPPIVVLIEAESLRQQLNKLRAQRYGAPHILRISKLLLPLVANPAEGGPVPLFALRDSLDQFEVDLGAVREASLSSR